jgi:hypothetical protein
MWFFLVIYALIGLAMFEWAWSKTKIHRNKDDARDSHFPAWSRIDVHRWNKMKMYPFAMTILPFKLFSFVFILAVLYFTVR